MNSKVTPFVLDTNAYALLFGDQTNLACIRLKEKINSSGGLSFYLPEIVAMEIHSVIGKYRRGGAKQREEPCSRHIVIANGSEPCKNTCFNAARTRMPSKVFKALQKLMDDIENTRGSIRATMLPLGMAEILEAKRLLARYAGQYAFGSHDALVAGTVLVMNSKGVNLALVTSDRGLKAVSNHVGVTLYDPLST